MCKMFMWNLKSKLSIREKQMVKKITKGLLLAEGDSNPHGTGLYLENWEGHKKLIKRPYEAKKFIVRDADLLDFYFQFSLKFILGHVRYTTSGKNDEKNTHPHKFKNFIGMHNGVLKMEELKKKAKEYGVKVQKTDSDTKIFFKIINKLNNLLGETFHLPEVLKEILESVYLGTYTFVMKIFKTDEVYVIRSGRPWVFYKTPFGLLGTSTKEMFKKALYYAGLEEIASKVEKVEVKENTLYRVQGDRIKKEIEIIQPAPIPKIPTVWYPPKEYYGYDHSYNYNGYDYEYNYNGYDYGYEKDFGNYEEYDYGYEYCRDQYDSYDDYLNDCLDELYDELELARINGDEELYYVIKGEIRKLESKIRERRKKKKKNKCKFLKEIYW